MKTINVPYYTSSVEFHIDDMNLKAVLCSKQDDYKTKKSEEQLILDALHAPIGTQSLRELAKNKQRVTIVTSDHTRAVPSKVTLPLILEEIRKGNPAADITILIATGLHRATTEEEQRRMFGDQIVDHEKIVVNNAYDPEQFDCLGTLPSGAILNVNKVAVESDLLITEGLIEPHFFAGFSGGRKSILPGVCDQKTVNENHSYKAISNRHSKTGVLQHNPIHEDMVAAARMANVEFILNVVLDKNKKVIAAFAGDLEEAHLKGVEFLRSLSQREKVIGDIVITSNGGYPLDQNLYQSPKAVATAASCAGENGVIIMCCSCVDGMGGTNFAKLIRMGTPDEIDSYLSKIPPSETIPEQWCPQIYARILKNHPVILMTTFLPEDQIREANMIPAKTPEEALKIALELKGREAQIVAIPDGVSVLINENIEPKKIALKVNELDNVATVFSNSVCNGDRIEIRDKKGDIEIIDILDDIPYGHKVAVCDISKGEDIYKYGEVIGRATQIIRKGEYVHIHNLESKRGRGDWKGELE